jgi:hypothetical protein
MIRVESDSIKALPANIPVYDEAAPSTKQEEGNAFRWLD